MTWALARTDIVKDCPDYLWRLDDWRDGDRQMVFVHLDFRQFRKGALRTFDKEWAAFRDMIDGPLYATSPVSDEKWERFMSRFGFTYLSEWANGQKLYISLKGTPDGQPLHQHKV